MRKEVIVVSGAATLLIIAVIAGFSMFAVSGDPTNVTFSVNLTISGNADPVITWVQTGLSVNPLESSTRTVYIAFNASDSNGYQDIDYGAAALILTINGEPQKAATVCTNYKNTTLEMAFNCTVTFQYYDIDGAWQVNATIADSQTAVSDTSASFTYGSLQAVRTNIQGVTFGSVTLGQTTGGTNDPLVLNNTGNQNFTEIRVRAFDLVGQDVPSQYIPSSSLTVNATNDARGQALSNSTQVLVSNAILARDIGGTDANANLYFWVAVPGAGLSNQDYISYEDWVVDVS